MRSKWFCKYKLAHRGLHNDIFPENSLGAFENACTYGFAIELDVRLLKDDTVVVFHDENLKRMCGVDIDLNDITAEELNKYALNKSKYNIPTLKQVLEIVDKRVPIMIELKPLRKKEHLEERVYDIIKNYKGDLAVKSFNPFTMLWFKKHAPQVLRGMLSSFFQDIHLPPLHKIALKRLWMYNFVKPDFISYNIDNLPNRYVKKRNVPVLAWTITNKDQEKDALTKADNVIFENYLPDKPTNY